MVTALRRIARLDYDPADFDFPYEEAGPEEGQEAALRAAEGHARRNGILEGRHSPRTDRSENGNA